MQEPGEPLFLTDDRAKMVALWLWRAEHCPDCNQRRADWLDENGEELRDPPFEVAETLCPACGWLEDYEESNPKASRRQGVKLYFRRIVDFVDARLHPGSAPGSR